MWQSKLQLDFQCQFSIVKDTKQQQNHIILTEEGVVLFELLADVCRAAQCQRKLRVILAFFELYHCCR